MSTDDVGWISQKSTTKKQLLFHVLFIVLSVVCIGLGITLLAALPNNSWAPVFGGLFILGGLIGGVATVGAYGVPWKWRVTEGQEAKIE